MADSIERAWGRILAWLRSNAPEDAIDPFPPPAPATAAALEAAIGASLPSELVEFHAVLHRLGSSSALPAADDRMAFTPLSLEEILDSWKTLRDVCSEGDSAPREPADAAEVADPWRPPGWLPFAGNGGGDLFCVDLAPGSAEAVGRIVAFDHESGRRRLLAASLEAYLQALADRVESGAFEFDSTYGLTAARSEPASEAADDLMTGMTEWHYDNALRQAEAAFKNKDYALLVAHLTRFEARLDKLPATRLAFARKKLADPR